MIDHLPCKPERKSWRPLIEWVVVCLLLAVVLYLLGA